MRIPPKNLLSTSNMNYLYKCDIETIFASKTWANYMYMERFDLITNFIRENLSTSCNIIDIGCAQGNYSICLSEYGYRVIGMDIRKSFLEYALLKIEDPKKLNLDLCIADSNSLPFGSDSFDCVLLLEIIEHVKYPEKILREAHRILRKGGLLILSTVNKKRVTSRSKSFNEFKRDRLLDRPFATNTAKGSEHLFELTDDECHNILVESGFVIHSSWTIAFMGMYLLIPIFKRFPQNILRNVSNAFLKISPIKEMLGFDIVIIAQKCI